MHAERATAGRPRCLSPDRHRRVNTTIFVDNKDSGSAKIKLGSDVNSGTSTVCRGDVVDDGSENNSDDIY